MKSDFKKIGDALVELGQSLIMEEKPIGDDIIKVGMGILGEQAVRRFFVKKDFPHMQVDLIFQNEKGEYRLAEIKRQSRFTAPPFDGHGLPPWQVKARLLFMDKTGIEPWLFIIEPGNESVILCQSIKILDALPKDEQFTTKTGSRRIYHIDRFHKISM